MRLLQRFRRLATGIAVLTCLSMAACVSSKAPVSNSTGTGVSPATNATSTPPPPASKTPSAIAVDSMTVITQAEAAAALGQNVRPAVRGKATVEGGIAAVFYGPSVPAGADPDVAVPNSVRVVLVTGPKARSYFNDYRGKVHAVALTGLGDQAYYDGYASVSVLKGDAYVRIAVVGAHGTSLPAEKTLAADALTRMP